MARYGAQSNAEIQIREVGSERRLRSLWKGKGKLNLRSHELAVETSYKQHENGSSEAVFSLVPGPGTHYFRYRGSWFQVKTASASLFSKVLTS